jgi:hypothetical protein
MSTGMKRISELPGYVDLDALMAMPYQEEPWIAYGLIAPQRMTALVGDAKIGKSLLALEMAVAISNGSDFLGRATTKTKTLYIDMENNVESDVKTRLHQMGFGPGDFDNLYYLSFPTLAALDTEAGGLYLSKIVSEHGIECVFLDTISRLVQGEENSNDTWNKFYNYTELLLKQLKVAVLRIDHTGKDRSKGARGGSAKKGDVDLEIRMTATQKNQFTLGCDVKRMHSGFDLMHIERKEEPRLHHAVSAQSSRNNFEGRVVAMCQMLDEGGCTQELSVKATRTVINGLGITCSNAIIEEVVRRRKSPRSADQVEFGPESSRPTNDSGSVHYWAVPSRAGMSRLRSRPHQRCLN